MIHLSLKRHRNLSVLQHIFKSFLDPGGEFWSTDGHEAQESINFKTYFQEFLRSQVLNFGHLMAKNEHLENVLFKRLFRKI